MPPEGADHIKGQACLDCKRNILQLEGQIRESDPARADVPAMPYVEAVAVRLWLSTISLASGCGRQAHTRMPRMFYIVRYRATSVEGVPAVLGGARRPPYPRLVFPTREEDNWETPAREISASP
jgi:hypothetical protein